MKKVQTAVLIGMLVFLLPKSSHADIALIVSYDSPITLISDVDLKAIYLGERSYLNNQEVKPSHLQAGNKIYKHFIIAVLKMTPRQYKLKWMKNIFTEGISPPEEKQNPSEIIMFVRNNKGGIGYVDKSDAEGKKEIKIIKTFSIKKSVP